MKLRLDTDGKISAIYEDGIQEFLNKLGTTTIRRASNVEWEEAAGGWTVRAAHDNELAIRIDGQVSRAGPIAVWASRAEALKAEVEHFWELVP